MEGRRIGEGTRIWAFAHVQEGSRIGKACNVCGGVFVEDGAVIGDGVTVKNGVSVWKGVTLGHGVFVGPGAIFTNDLRPRAFRRRPEAEWLVPTTIGHGATIGAGAVVVAGCHVGRFAFVAAGAVVTRPVAPHALVMGNPARRKAWVCSCGLRLPASLRCPCGLAWKRGSEGLSSREPGAATRASAARSRKRRKKPAEGPA